MASRQSNENRFKQWRASETGGRIYYKKVAGLYGRYAFYFKEVDEHESIVRFWQEVYNAKDELIEIHEKYPIDNGHQKINRI